LEKKKILFVIGSINQTTQMHQISQCLPEYDCYFSQLFDNNPFINLILKLKLVESTVMADHFRLRADEYLKKHNLKNDFRMEVYDNKYDLVVMCTEMIFPKRVWKLKTIWVQEGMTDPLNTWSKIVLKLRMHPCFTFSTSLNGSLNRADVYCAGSEGYKEKFVSSGTDAEKIIATGIVNFDNHQKQRSIDLPYKNYVLVATSDIRELYGFDNRKKFIKNCVKIAKGRQLIFKTHPNENQDRAIREFRKYAPENAVIFTEGMVDGMIPNCDVLITQYSTSAYIGLGWGKEVYSYFNMDELRKLTPMQNNGTSAQRIAAVCKRYIEFKGDKKDFLKELEKPEEIFSKLAEAI
jgi:hypothetical protein